MEDLLRNPSEIVNKDRCRELIRRPDTRKLLNSLIFARAIVELDLNPRDIYCSEYTDEKDSLMGCLTAYPVSRNREDLVEKLECRFSWVRDFRGLSHEDYRDIVNITEDIWSFMSEME
jgi:hypothetical protein